MLVACAGAILCCAVDARAQVVLKEFNHSYVRIVGTAQGGQLTLGPLHGSFVVTISTSPGESAAQMAARLEAASPMVGGPEPFPWIEAVGDLLKVQSGSINNLFVRTTDPGIQTIGKVQGLTALASKANNNVELTWTLPSPAPAKIVLSRGVDLCKFLPGTTTSYVDSQFGPDVNSPAQGYVVTYTLLCVGPETYTGNGGVYPTNVSDYVSISADSPTEMPDDVFCILTDGLPLGVTGQYYEEELEKNAGVNPVTWDIASGELPPGLLLSPAGVVYGVPTTETSSSIVLLVTDSAAGTATKTITAAVMPLSDYDDVIDQ